MKSRKFIESGRKRTACGESAARRAVFRSRAATRLGLPAVQRGDEGSRRRAAGISLGSEP
jgi:hypothetical protein